MKIYTGQGDTGNTGLFDGRKVRKDHLRIEAYGTVDELSSELGVAIVDCPHPALAELLRTLQFQLFDLGADLATPLDAPNAHKTRRITATHIAFIEAQIDAATAQIPALKHFILPGGSRTAAQLHVARTVCRRAERLTVTLSASEDLGDQVIIYLNRLSDLLFTLARWANHLEGITDVEWIPPSP